jgi:hypothetical protein
MNTRPKILAASALAAIFLAPHVAFADIRPTQDYVPGNGTTGPYSLSWKNVLLGTETVTLDGTVLHWGADYNFDATAGTITFTHPLTTDEAAAVQYDYDTAKAQAQGSGLNLPLTLALNSHLSLGGQFTAPAGSVAQAGALNVALNGSWLNTQKDSLTTHLLFLPVTTGADAQEAPNGLDRVGLDVAGKTNLGRSLALGFDASRAGNGLGSVNGNDWTAGQQKLNFNGTFTPNTEMQTAFTYAQATPTALRDAETQTVTANTTLKPNKKTELDAAFTNTSSPTVTKDAQNLDLKAAVTVTPQISLNAESQQSATGTSGVTQTLHANAVLKPTGQTQLNAAYCSTDAPGQANDTQTFNLNASLTPNKIWQLSTNLAMSQTAVSSTQATSVNGTAQPNKFLKVSGGYTWRNVAALQADALPASESSIAQVTLLPLSALHLVGTYDQNPMDSSGNPQQQADHGLSLQTSLGALSLNGGYTWTRQYAAAATATSLDVGLGLRFSSNTELTGDYKHCLTDSATPGGTDAYTVGLNRNLGDAFDLSFNGTLQQQTGVSAATAPTLTASANLGMKF